MYRIQVIKRGQQPAVDFLREADGQTIAEYPSLEQAEDARLGLVNDLTNAMEAITFRVVYHHGEK